MWQPFLPALLILLLHYSNATFYAAESGPQLLQYDNDQQVANLVEELARVNRLGEGAGKQPPYDEYGGSEGSSMYDIDLQNAEENEVPKADVKPMIAQKKGQSEYVEFIEPKVSNQMKHVESVDKRVPAEESTGRRTSLKPMLHVGNFLFLAIATVCMIAMAAGVASGSYYFYKVRSQKAVADGCDFTYAPAGPGKSKKKKGGDEGLAYKAQLHYYQQAKQKIISGEDGAVTLPDADETSETSDDENNFSVYECPGLAPTGDIEVQNPNFVSRP